MPKRPPNNIWTKWYKCKRPSTSCSYFERLKKPHARAGTLPQAAEECTERPSSPSRKALPSRLRFQTAARLSAACSTFCRTHEILTLVTKSLKGWKGMEASGAWTRPIAIRSRIDQISLCLTCPPPPCTLENDKWIIRLKCKAMPRIFAAKNRAVGYFHCILLRTSVTKSLSLVDMILCIQ